MLKEKISKAIIKNIRIFKKLSNVFLKHSFITLHTNLVKSHLDYVGVVFEQPDNDIRCQPTESLKYNTSLAITGATKETSEVEFCNEIDLESPESKRWFKKLFICYKIKNTYITFLILFQEINHVHNTRSFDDMSVFCNRLDTFTKSFFPSVISEWNKLDLKIQQSKTPMIFEILC